MPIAYDPLNPGEWDDPYPTYRRLRDNVEAQTRGRIGMKALSRAVRRPWLANLLPKNAPLLRAPLIAHLILEDWLLAQTPP